MQREQFNVWFVGLLALGCLIVGWTMLALGSQNLMIPAGLIRLGLLLGALWLALPTKGRAAAWANISPWWIAGGAVALFYLVRYPRVLLPMALGAVIAIAVINVLTGRTRR